MQIAPTGERILVQQEELATKSVGGVLLPTSAVDRRALLAGKVREGEGGRERVGEGCENV